MFYDVCRSVLTCGRYCVCLLGRVCSCLLCWRHANCIQLCLVSTLLLLVCRMFRGRGSCLTVRASSCDIVLTHCFVCVMLGASCCVLLVLAHV